MRIRTLATLLLFALAAPAAAQQYGTVNALRVVTRASTLTIADNGGGTAASGTVLVAEAGYVEVDCQDSNGCTVTVSESGANEGADLTIMQVSASPGNLTISDSSAVVELLNGTAYVFAQYEALTLKYVGDRWVETSRTQFAGAETASSVATLTNKTLDAEGTGNSLTVPFTRWIQGAICNNATPSAPEWSFPTSNPAVPACQTGTNTQFGTLDFADGASPLSAQWHQMLPSDWSGTVGVTLKWFTSATSGSVVWQVSTICVANAETADPAFNTASTVTDAALGTTLQLNDATIASVTVTGCAAGELLFLRVLRDPTNASDTLAATARLVGLELKYRRAM